MAETVTLSPPSFALRASEQGPRIPTPVEKIARPAPKNAPKAAETGVAKRKQSKSRNGA
jgi:hypothetical protein